MSKTIDIIWDRRTDMREGRLTVEASHGYLNGVAMPIEWNGREVGRMNWGAFDTAKRRVVVAVIPRKGPNTLRLTPTTAQGVLVGVPGTVDGATVAITFIGEDPNTSAPRKTVGQVGAEFLSNLAGTAPWVLGVLAVIGVVFAIILIRLRSPV